MLRVEDLSASYGAARVLGGVSLQVARGEVVALMGRNGAGKTTTLKAIMGLLADRGGRVIFNGRDVSRLDTYRIARSGLGFTPEDRRIFTDLTIAENLDIGRQPPRSFADGTLAPVWDEARVFALFPQLREMTDRLGGQMSGGEQQMLTIARTLMGNPLMLLLDEPSEGIAPIVIEQIAAAISAMKAAGVSVLLSEQNIHFAGLVAERVVILEKGQVRWQGAMRDLLRDPALQRAHLTL